MTEEALLEYVHQRIDEGFAPGEVQKQLLLSGTDPDLVASTFEKLGREKNPDDVARKATKQILDLEKRWAEARKPNRIRALQLKFADRNAIVKFLVQSSVVSTVERAVNVLLAFVVIALSIALILFYYFFLYPSFSHPYNTLPNPITCALKDGVVPAGCH